MQGNGFRTPPVKGVGQPDLSNLFRVGGRDLDGKGLPLYPPPSGRFGSDMEGGAAGKSEESEENQC